MALGSLDEKSMKESGKELPGVKEHVFLGEKMGWNEFVGVENFVGMKEELVMKMKGWREERERELEIRIGV